MVYEGEEGKELCVKMEPTRKRLPDERNGITYSKHVDAIGGAKVDITTGEYDNGTLGEVFIKVDKEGSILAAYDGFAIALSIGLQHGIPLKTFIDKLKYMKFEPSGVTANKLGIPMADSVFDLVAKFLEEKYL